MVGGGFFGGRGLALGFSNPLGLGFGGFRVRVWGFGGAGFGGVGFRV